MNLFNWFRVFFSKKRIKTNLEELEKSEKHIQGLKEELVEEICSIWDLLRFQENTQASHLSKTIDFNEWIDMEEIRRRVEQLFGISYKNERSLYPYLKTLVDCGLMETTNIGGRRKWRKKDLVYKVLVKKEKKTDNELAKLAQGVN